MVRFLSAAFALLISTALALAQTANINGIYLTGSPPTGFASQLFKFDCSTSPPTSGTCWPIMELLNQNPNGQNSPANSQPVVLPIGQTPADPCTFHGSVIGTITKTTVAFSSTLGEFQIVPAVALTQVYVCSIIAVTTAATSMSLVQGLSPNCTTGPSQNPVVGSLTAANGMDIAANQGFVAGNGGATMFSSLTSGYALCILQSASGNKIAGSITYVQTQL